MEWVKYNLFMVDYFTSTFFNSLPPLTEFSLGESGFLASFAR